MKLKAQLLLLIFACSLGGLFFVAFITFESGNKLAATRMLSMLQTVGQHAVSMQEHSSSMSPEKDELAGAGILDMPGLIAIVINNENKVEKISFGDFEDISPDHFENIASILAKKVSGTDTVRAGGQDFIWSRFELNDQIHSLLLLYPSSEKDYSQLVKSLVVPTLIAGGIALWASVWAAIILANLMAKARQREVLQIQVDERTSELKLARDRAEASDQLKSQIITTMSHELRTPLTSIIGSIRLVRHNAVGTVNADVQELLDMAWDNARRMSALVDEIVDIERIEAGAFQLERGQLDLSDLVRDAVALNQGYALEHGVKITAHDIADDVIVDADKRRVHQVLANLISNAVKFSVKSETVITSLSANNKMAKITVSNVGPTISEDIRDQVFEKFVRGDNVDGRNSNGAGLGLSIAKDIIEQHGGQIGFDSVPDKRTTFFFELPLMRVEA